MLHELTVGGTGAPPKHQLLGALQRELIIRPLARLARVKRIQTNLAEHAEALSLFSTIPITAARFAQSLAAADTAMNPSHASSGRGA